MVGVSAADGVGSVGVVAVDVVGIVFVDLCSEGNAKIRLCFFDKVVFFSRSWVTLFSPTKRCL